MLDINIEDYLPHRGKMKLIDEALEVDDGMAVTVSTVTKDWPLEEGDRVSPVVLVELVAQSSNLAVMWEKKKNGDEGGKGWLVGIKKAEFFIDAVPLHSRLITAVEEVYASDNYVVLEGTVSLNDNLIAKITIQAFKPSKDLEKMLSQGVVIDG